jgi:hypothetical protein
MGCEMTESEPTLYVITIQIFVIILLVIMIYCLINMMIHAADINYVYCKHLVSGSDYWNSSGICDNLTVLGVK